MGPHEALLEIRRSRRVFQSISRLSKSSSESCSRQSQYSKSGNKSTSHKSQLPWKGPAAGGEALKIRGTPLGEHGVMKLSVILQILKLDGPRPRRRPTPKNITKLKKNQACKKTRFFSKSKSKVGLKLEPKIVENGSRRVFCVTEKTLNSASVFFRAFTVSGTAGPSPIVNFPCENHNFRDETLSQK